jgi:hypothetical protein
MDRPAAPMHIFLFMRTKCLRTEGTHVRKFCTSTMATGPLTHRISILPTAMCSGSPLARPTRSLHAASKLCVRVRPRHRSVLSLLIFIREVDDWSPCSESPGDDNDNGCQAKGGNAADYRDVIRSDGGSGTKPFQRALEDFHQGAMWDRLRGHGRNEE